MTLFELAVRTAIPVIGVSTDDYFNAVPIMQLIAGAKVVRLIPKQFIASNDALLWTPDSDEITVDVYKHCLEKSKQIIVLNPEKKNLIFDAGELPVPPSMVAKYLTEMQVMPDMLPSVTAALKGLSLKVIGEIVALTQARCGCTTPKELRATRLMIMGTTPGLASVDTSLDFYVWPAKLQQWAELNAKYFLGDYHHKLVPRGILIEGHPGTGKSTAAKAIANQFGVPLYRMDVALTLGRYISESEKQLAKALAMVEREEPAILLLDETEKVFNTTADESGTLSRMLGQLLWWLAEHRAKVFTVMTTNKKLAIPPELYRPGRIDWTLEIERLWIEEAVSFASKVYESVMNESASNDRLDSVGVTLRRDPSATRFSHAEVEEAVYETIKTQGWLK